MVKKVVSILTALVMTSGLLTGCLSTGTKPDAKPTQTTPAPQATSKDVKVIKISNGVDQGHPTITAFNEKFKKLVEEKTNGRYKVEVYFSSQLGDDIKATEALRAGTLESCNTSTSPLVGMVKELAVFDIPFLFPNEKVADAVLDGEIGKKLSDLLLEKGLVNLAWNENGFRHLTNSVRSVSTPADVKGMKIRTMENSLHLAAWKAIGANPTPMPQAEVFTALQQHAIDGQENPVPNFYAKRIHEVNKYVSLTGHIYTPFMFLFSKKIFDTYPKADQEIIMAAARETALYERQLNREATVKNLEDIKKEGGTVTVLTDAQKKAFQDLTLPVWDLVSEKVGKTLIDQLKSEIAKANK